MFHLHVGVYTVHVRITLFNLSCDSLKAIVLFGYNESRMEYSRFTLSSGNFLMKSSDINVIL